VPAWPDWDRKLWEEARAPRESRFSTSRPLIRWSEASWKTNTAGYGRWANFMTLSGRLDRASKPQDRLTEDNLNAYFWHLREMGGSDQTIITRFESLQAAMSVFDPHGDFSWITRPHEQSLRKVLAMRRRRIKPHAPVELFLRGLELMRDALSVIEPMRRRLQLRDGLIIAMQSLQGFRATSLLSLSIGTSICRTPEEGIWRFELAPKDVKNQRYISGPVPRLLQVWVDRYLEVERRELLGGRQTNVFWLNQAGMPLAGGGLQDALYRRSAARFREEERFAAHHFRYCIATYASLVLPESPGIAAAVLRISGTVLDEHYDRSNGILATQSYHKVIEQELRATRDIAQQGFKKRHSRTSLSVKDKVSDDARRDLQPFLL
jgi:hypothetical protein